MDANNLALPSQEQELHYNIYSQIENSNVTEIIVIIFYSITVFTVFLSKYLLMLIRFT